MRRFLVRLTAVCVTVACLVLTMFPVSAQASASELSLEDNRVLRQELIPQMGSVRTGQRIPPVELPPIPRDTFRPVGKIISAIDKDAYYGRQLLAASENPDLVKAYDFFDQKVSALEQVVHFEAFRVTLQDVIKIYNYYRNDHPEAFWLPSGFQYFTFGYSFITGMPSITLLYEYTVPKEQIVPLQQQLKARLAEFLDGITGEMSQEQRERVVLERLNGAVAYDHSMQATHNRDVLGMMLYGSGVCESYARTFQYLMYHCGIPCLYVVGDTTSGAHAWNMVYIDGEWLMVDPTGCDSDIDSKIVETYFNLTYEEFLENPWYTSIADDEAYYYPLPIETDADPNAK